MEGIGREISTIVSDGGTDEQQNNKSITMELAMDPDASSLAVGANAQGDNNMVL